MARVQENIAKLKPKDRAAIAAYLKTLPPLPDAVPKKKKGAGKEEDEGRRGQEGRGRGEEVGRSAGRAVERHPVPHGHQASGEIA